MLFFRLYSKKTIFVGKDSSMDDKWKALEKYNLWGGNTYQLGLERKSYTDKIGNFVGNNLVKVLIGQRRSGKSYILRQIASSLVSERGVNPANILYINKEYLEFDFIDDYKALESLYRFYREKLKPQGKVYLFFDEIQNVDGWERFVNSHSQDFVEESELFISGSNSKMLSSELATLLSGRYVEFHIFPYSYAEYLPSNTMYNFVTEELIKKIPHVEGFTEELLPVTLTKIYAQIISLSAKYEDGEIPFDLEVLKSDGKKLNILSNTLELYLFANSQTDKRKSMAFVAATARKLLFKIKEVHEDEVLDLNYIPSDLYASLLYVISGNFADAQEVAEGFCVRREADQYVKKLYNSIKLLVSGNLHELQSLTINEPKEYNDLQQYTEWLR